MRQANAMWTAAIMLAGTALAWAGNWPAFRGADGSGASSEKQVPAEWDNEKNVAWKAKLPGYGWSCPIVWGDKVFVTSAASEKQSKPTGGFGGGRPGRDRTPPDATFKWEIYCLNAADGKILWKQTAVEQKPTIAIHPSNTYATETPVTDGERVYVYFGMTGVFCYDFEGKLLWKKDLGSYRMAMGYGTGSSPALDDKRLFIQCDNEEKSFLVALDKKTGDEVWRVERNERSTWSTPFIWKNKQRTEVVCLGRKVRSYDPENGKVLWELGGMNGMCNASPVASADLLYVGTGGGPGPGGRPGGPGGPGSGNRPLFAVKAGAKGDITLKDNETSNEGVAWFNPKAGPSMASPLLYDGNLYILEQRGSLLTCLDAATGKENYRERLPGGRGYTSSPWAYDGKIFCLSDDGQTSVVKAGPEFKLLGSNKLDEMCWSTPAVAGSTLYLRTVDHLYCIRSKK